MGSGAVILSSMVTIIICRQQHSLCTRGIFLIEMRAFVTVVIHMLSHVTGT